MHMNVLWLVLLVVSCIALFGHASTNTGYTPTQQWRGYWDFYAAEDIDSALSGWTGYVSQFSLVAGSGIQVCQTSNSSSVYASLSLSSSAWTPGPTTLTVRSMVSADGVSQPPNSWNGIKVMAVILYVGETTPEYTNPPNQYGTWDWKNESMSFQFPEEGVTSVTIILGLELVSGCATFHDLEINSYTVPTGWNFDYGLDSNIYLRGANIPPNLGSDDFVVFGKNGWNGNLVRWQITDSRLTTSNTSLWWPLLQESLDAFDAMKDTLASNGIIALLDLHAVPGGRDANYEEYMQFSQGMLDAFVDLWANVAQRYQGKYDTIWAFDILNEPVFLGEDGQTQVSTWPELAERTCQAILDADPGRHIVVSFISWGSPQSPPTAPVPLPNIIYTIHMYTPMCFTHQGVYPQYPYGVDYPSTIDCGYVADWNKAKLADYLSTSLEWSQRFHIAIFVGEFSAIRWAYNSSAYRYLKDLIEVMEENHWFWAYHAFREWSGWSVEYTENISNPYPATEPTQRQLLLESYYSSNSNPYDSSSGTHEINFSSRLSFSVVFQGVCLFCTLAYFII